MITMFYDKLKAAAANIRKPKMAKVFMSQSELTKIMQNRFGSVKTSRGCNGVELLTTCPFCGKAEKLSVNPSKRVYHCWHCDSSGTLASLIGTNVTIAGALVVQDTPKEQKVVYPPSFDPSQIIPLDGLSEDNPAIVYLKSRGFDPKELNDDYGFRYCRSGRWFPHVPFNSSNTIIIPIYSSTRFLGWQSRLLYDPKKVSDEAMEAVGYKERKDSGELKRPPKYLTSPGLRKQEILYNIDWAKKFDTVVVTEGVFDCIRVGRQGVATLGKSVSDYQKKMLMSLWRTVVLLLDPDAKTSQDRLVKDLTVSGGPRIVPVSLKGYKDAGDCPRDELWRQINSAING